MTAGILDITIEQGTSISRTFTVTTDGSTPVDLTGYSCRMQIREDTDSKAVIASYNNSNGKLTVSSPASGVLTWTVTNTETAAYKFNTAVYDLEIISGSGIVTRLLQGEVTLSKEVTK